MNRGSAMQQPDPDHVMFITRWASEIIFGLVTILLVVVRWIGKATKSDNVPYVTRDEMQNCQQQLMREFKEMRGELNGKIDHAHDKIYQDIIHAHERIDRIVDK